MQTVLLFITLFKIPAINNETAQDQNVFLNWKAWHQAFSLWETN